MGEFAFDFFEEHKPVPEPVEVDGDAFERMRAYDRQSMPLSFPDRSDWTQPEVLGEVGWSPDFQGREYPILKTLPIPSNFIGGAPTLFDVPLFGFGEKWDRRFLEVAKLVSTWSKDPSTQVGAVLVDADRHIVGTGYNGFPAGVVDSDERYNDRETKYKFVVHAEVNAVIQAGPKAKGSILYVYPSFSLPPVCAECAKVVIQAGIKGVVGYSPDLSDPRVQRWVDSISVSKEMWDEVGLFIVSYDE